MSFGPTGDLNRSLDVNLIYSIALADSMTNHISSSTYIKEVNGKVKRYFSEVLTLIKLEECSELASAWKSVMSSIQEIAGYEWQDIRLRIEKLIKRHRLIGAEWGLSDEAREHKAKNYIYSKALLIECLQQATVTNRRGLETRLASNEFLSIQ